jgi:hypothetical protein
MDRDRMSLILRDFSDSYSDEYTTSYGLIDRGGGFY